MYCSCPADQPGQMKVGRGRLRSGFPHAVPQGGRQPAKRHREHQESRHPQQDERLQKEQPLDGLRFRHLRNQTMSAYGKASE